MASPFSVSFSLTNYSFAELESRLMTGRKMFPCVSLTSDVNLRIFNDDDFIRHKIWRKGNKKLIVYETEGKIN